MAEYKHCPLRFVGADSPLASFCLKEKCEWWVLPEEPPVRAEEAKSGRCALPLIAQCLKRLPTEAPSRPT